MRDFSTGVLLTLCLALFACGDTGGSPGADATGDVGPNDPPGRDLVLTPVEGTVSPGFGFEVAKVTNGFDEVAVDGESFRIRTPEGDRHLAIALSDAGHAVALAWFGPGHTTIDARSTAEVMAYIALGGYHAPAELHPTLIALLDEAPELDALADDLSRLGFRYPEGFDGDPDYGLQSRLEEACEELLKSDRVPRALLINPSDERSGLRLDNLGSLNEVTFTNRFRRRAHVFIERVAIVKDGVETLVEEPITELTITPVTGLRDGVGTLKQIVSGAADPRDFAANQDVAYVPKTFGPVALPNVDGADRTRYRVAAVGPGDSPGDLASLRPNEVKQQYETSLEFLVRDYLVPFLTDVVAPTKMVMSGADDDYATKVIMDLLRDSVEIQDSLLAGKTGQALQVIIGGGTAYGKLPKAILKKVVETVVDRVYGPNGAKNAALAAGITGPLDKLIGVFGGVNVGLKLYDSALIEFDMAHSNRADTWEVVATKANVRLDPVESTIPPGDFVTLTANVVDAGDNDVFEYRFQTAGKAGTLQSALRRGDDITTSVPYITYDAREPGNDEVSVTVLLVQGNARVELGRARATVAVAGSGVRISPNMVDLAAFEEQTLSATLFGDTLPPTVTFRWSTAGAYGALAGNTTEEVTGTSHEVRYVAGYRPGHDEVVVEVLVPGEAEPIARSRVSVRVTAMRAYIAPTNASIGAGEEVELTGSVLPAPPRGTLTYRWSVGGEGTLDGAPSVEHSGAEASDTVTYQAVDNPSGCAQEVNLQVSYRDGVELELLLPTRTLVRVDCPVEATILAPRDRVLVDGAMNLTCDIGRADPEGLTYTWSVTNYGDAEAAIDGEGRTARLLGGPEDGYVGVTCEVRRDGALVAAASEMFLIFEEPEPPCQEAFAYEFWNSENYGMQMAVSGAYGGRVTVDVFVPYWPEDLYWLSVNVTVGG